MVRLGLKRANICWMKISHFESTLNRLSKPTVLEKTKDLNNGHQTARIYEIRRSEYNKALALLGTRTLQTLSSVTLSCSSKRKKPIPT